MSGHRRPAIPFTDAPRGTCRWCGDAIVYASGPRKGLPDRRRRWHPDCGDVYNESDPREARRRVRRRDRGVCAACGLDTLALRRELRGRGLVARLRERGFLPRRSLWELDHVVPLVDGGGHDLSNLQTLCAPCHREKTASEQRSRVERPAAAAGAGQAGRPGAPLGSQEGDALEREMDALLSRADAANARVEEILGTDS